MNNDRSPAEILLDASIPEKAKWGVIDDIERKLERTEDYNNNDLNFSEPGGYIAYWNTLARAARSDIELARVLNRAYINLDSLRCDAEGYADNERYLFERGLRSHKQVNRIAWVKTAAEFGEAAQGFSDRFEALTADWDARKMSEVFSVLRN